MSKPTTDNSVLNHHLEQHKGIWYARLRLLRAKGSKRVTRSLRTDDIEEARIRRDALIRGLAAAGEVVILQVVEGREQRR